MQRLKRRRIVISLGYGMIALNYFLVWFYALFLDSLPSGLASVPVDYLWVLGLAMGLMVPICLTEKEEKRLSQGVLVSTVAFLHPLMSAVLAIYISWWVLVLIVPETVLLILLANIYRIRKRK